MPILSVKLKNATRQDKPKRTEWLAETSVVPRDNRRHLKKQREKLSETKRNEAFPEPKPNVSNSLTTETLHTIFMVSSVMRGWSSPLFHKIIKWYFLFLFSWINWKDAALCSVHLGTDLQTGIYVALQTDWHQRYHHLHSADLEVSWLYDYDCFKFPALAACIHTDRLPPSLNAFAISAFIFHIFVSGRGFLAVKLKISFLTSHLFIWRAHISF